MLRLKRILIQSLVILVLGAGLGFAVNWFSGQHVPLKYQPRHQDETWPILDYETVRHYTEEGSAIFVDAREPNEFEAGHIPQAINLPAYQFGDYFAAQGEALPREGIPLVVYCQGDPCDQSHEVLDYLKALEFRDLYLYLGGWNDWIRKSDSE